MRTKRALLGVAVVLVLASCSSHGAPSASTGTAPTGTAAPFGSGLGGSNGGPALRSFGSGFGLGTAGTVPTGTACTARPAAPKVEALPWLPTTLPLPVGSYGVRSLGETAGPQQAGGNPMVYHSGLLVVAGTLLDFERFVEAQWPGAGYVLGRGEAELGEAELSFTKGADIGAFRARADLCEPNWTTVKLVYGTTSTAGPPTVAP
jgi:hypothetical protein